MSHSIDNETGHLLVDGVRVYAALDRGLLHGMVRATNRETFVQNALTVGLMVLDADENAIPHQNVTITEMGPLVLTPAVLDEDMEVLTPAVVDNRFHANFWLNQYATDAGDWEAFALSWTANGSPAAVNANEEGVAYNGIELIDPATVSSPSNVLL